MLAADSLWTSSRSCRTAPWLPLPAAPAEKPGPAWTASCFPPAPCRRAPCDGPCSLGGCGPGLLLLRTAPWCRVVGALSTAVPARTMRRRRDINALSRPRRNARWMRTKAQPQSAKAERALERKASPRTKAETSGPAGRSHPPPSRCTGILLSARPGALLALRNRVPDQLQLGQHGGQRRQRRQRRRGRVQGAGDRRPAARYLHPRAGRLPSARRGPALQTGGQVHPAIRLCRVGGYHGRDTRVALPLESVFPLLPPSRADSRTGRYERPRPEGPPTLAPRLRFPFLRPRRLARLLWRLPLGV